MKPIKAISRDDKIPLSFMQLLDWNFNKRRPDDAIMRNILMGYRLTGQLNAVALRDSFNELIRRHELLRTTFPEVNGEPVQEIAPTATVDISVVDLRSFSKTQQSTEIERLMLQIQKTPFDIINGPVWRVQLLRLESESHILLMCMHHMLIDAQSGGMLWEELVMLYDTLVSGNPSPLPPLPLQYADYAYWQRASFTPRMLQSRLNYWKKLFAEAPPLLELPTDKPRADGHTFPSGTEWFHLSPELTQKLNTLTQKTNTMFFTTMLASYATLLNCYSGSKKMVVGVPMSKRKHRETQEMIGYFAGMSALSVDIGGNPTFLELLPRVQKVVFSAIYYQDIKYNQIMQMLGLESQPSNKLPFRVAMNFFQMPRKTLNVPELTITRIKVERPTMLCDLAMGLWEEDHPAGTSLGGWLRYRTDLFERETIVRMLDNFQTLLKAIVAYPEQSVKELCDWMCENEVNGL